MTLKSMKSCKREVKSLMSVIGMVSGLRLPHSYLLQKKKNKKKQTPPCCSLNISRYFSLNIFTPSFKNLYDTFLTKWPQMSKVC